MTNCTCVDRPLPPGSADELRGIGSLRPDFIDHSQWALRKWYYANQLWYYHRPRGDAEMVLNRRFYALVDRLLHDLCKRLHELDLATTPSCSGHFYGDERFIAVWKELSAEARQVAGEGLIVCDAENNSKHLFRDPAYRLPWSSQAHFLEEATAQQGIGYLGILVPPDRRDMQESLGSLPSNIAAGELGFDDGVGRPFGLRLFSITTRPSGCEERDETWRAITGEVLNRLQRLQAAA